MPLETLNSKFFVPLRESPDAPDGSDGARILLAKNLWGSQDDLVRQRNRQIEENIRMLAGQQYSIYHPALGKWLDPSDWMTKEELRWRQRPVFNRLLPWYIITHARATENPPIITFVPGPDAIDAELADVMDIAHKSLWFECNMDDVNDRLMAWVIVAGMGHIETVLDPNGGDIKKWVGDDLIPTVDEYDQPITHPQTNEPLYQFGEQVPFGPDGKPRAVARQNWDGSTEIIHTGEPHQTKEGTLRVDVPSPLQVRGQWGPQPWHEKAWHAKKVFLTPEEVFERFGVECEPDVRGAGIADAGELERILFGTGFYGGTFDAITTQGGTGSTDGYCEVTEITMSPSQARKGMEQTEQSPGGRHLVVTKTQVLSDGPRPVAWPYTSSIRTFEFVRIPGRPGGTTPQESMNMVQRAYNEGYARIKEHVNLCTNPKALIDIASGIKPGQWNNAPGDNYRVNARPGVQAVSYIQPPPLGEDVYKLQQMLLQELQDLGNLHGTSGDAPTPDPSGELVKELRFNSDRFLGPTMRRSVSEYGRMSEDWRVALPVVWDDEKIIQHAGEDNIARTITVLPYMFEKGKINVRGDVESMLPEGRGEKQAKVYKMWLDGAFGPPESPMALQKFYELLHMPHLSRIAKPGGIDAVTAEQENGQLLQGVDPSMIPVYEWYDDDVHLMILEKYMKSPEFKKQDDQIKNGFVFHRMAHQMNKAKKMSAALAQQAAVQGALNPGAGGGGAAGKGGEPPSDGGAIAPGPPEPPQGIDQMPTAAAGAAVA